MAKNLGAILGCLVRFPQDDNAKLFDPGPAAQSTGSGPAERPIDAFRYPSILAALQPVGCTVGCREAGSRLRHRVSSVNSTTCLQISKPLYRNLGIFFRLLQCAVTESSVRPESAEIPALPIVGPPSGGGLAAGSVMALDLKWPSAIVFKD
jgi:hypothetical protein